MYSSSYCYWNYNNDHKKHKWNRRRAFGCAGILPGLLVLLISRFTKESIGMGDGVILMCYGLCAGFIGSLGVWILALFFSSLFSIVCLIFRKLQRKSEIPFTPFMFLAFLG